MNFLDFTLTTPEENVALDEALLEACEAGSITSEVLRVWEPPEYFVVLGRSSDPTIEVNLAACRAKQIPVLRRASGGGTILAGPGCLMYAVIIDSRAKPNLKQIPQAHCYVLGRMAAGLASLASGIHVEGTSDLAIHTESGGIKKFSGNALRMKRTHFLYHGTLLYNFDLDRVTEFLGQPTREPLYRANRAHRAFLGNLPTTREALIAAITATWQANEALTTWPRERMARIVKAKS